MARGGRCSRSRGGNFRGRAPGPRPPPRAVPRPSQVLLHPRPAAMPRTQAAPAVQAPQQSVSIPARPVPPRPPLPQHPRPPSQRQKSIPAAPRAQPQAVVRSQAPRPTPPRTSVVSQALGSVFASGMGPPAANSMRAQRPTSQDEVASSWASQPQREVRLIHEPLGVGPTGETHDYTGRFVSYFVETASGQRSVEQVVRNGRRSAEASSSEALHAGTEVDSQDLAEYDPEACIAVLQDPETVLPMLDAALVEAQKKLLSSSVAEPSWQLVARAHARLSHLPPLSTFEKTNVSALRSSDIGRMIQVTGSVVRSGSVRMLEVARVYECGTCSQRFRVPADRLENYVAKKPRRCLATLGCDSKRFTEFDVENTDYQELILQEHSDTLAIGRVPRSIVLCCEDDLVDTATAGDAVVVVGRLLVRWQPVHSEVRVDADMVLLVNSIRAPGSSRHLLGALLSAEDKKRFTEFWQARHQNLAARDTFIYSVCPDIYGRSVIKLALLLTLVGGISSEDADNKQQLVVEEEEEEASSDKDDHKHQEAPKSSWQRGTPHLLLIGDPGTGKSQFLRFAELVAPRSVLTTGTGTSSAGLTCAAVKGSDGQWTLEAGALPLADRGCCLIDEFGQMKSSDRAVIHEAMEQQSISFAKAGLVGKLPTRCAVVAACNPKNGTYDCHADLSTNTGLPPPLLSRFDVVLVIRDEKHQDWDLLAATAILQDQLAPNEQRLTADSEEDELEVLLADELQREAQTQALTESSSSGFATASIANSNLEAQKENCIAPRPSIDGLKPQDHCFVIRPKRKKLNKASHDEKIKKRKLSAATFRADQLWSLSDLRKYIVHVKQNFCPVITDDAGALLSKYYTHQRSRIGAASGRATVRMLESLIRLTQAHARIMARHHAGIQDAVIACILVDKSMGPSAAFDPSIEVIPDPHENTDSDAYFQYQRASVFDTLNFDPGRSFRRASHHSTSG